MVIISNTQQEIQAKKIGLYSTEQTRVHIDYIDQKLLTIALDKIPLRNPAYEKTDSMYVVNNWLLRSGPTEQFDFNYQKYANKIKCTMGILLYILQIIIIKEVTNQPLCVMKFYSFFYKIYI